MGCCFKKWNCNFFDWAINVVTQGLFFWAKMEIQSVSKPFHWCKIMTLAKLRRITPPGLYLIIWENIPQSDRLCVMYNVLYTLASLQWSMSLRGQNQFKAILGSIYTWSRSDNWEKSWKMSVMKYSYFGEAISILQHNL